MESFKFVDIILLAMVAGFLILRLRSTLGRRTGHENQPDNFSSDNKIVKLQSRKIDETPEAENLNLDPRYKGTKFEKGLLEILSIDPHFNINDFINGAKKAFEIILLAFSRYDKEALRPMLASDVYKSFETAICEREDLGEVSETELISINVAEFNEVGISGDVASIAMRFESEQINIIKSDDGQVVEGSKDQIEPVVDIWTFERNLKSDNPNWLLVSTKSVD